MTIGELRIDQPTEATGCEQCMHTGRTKPALVSSVCVMGCRSFMAMRLWSANRAAFFRNRDRPPPTTGVTTLGLTGPPGKSGERRQATGHRALRADKLTPLFAILAFSDVLRSPSSARSSDRDT